MLFLISCFFFAISSSSFCRLPRLNATCSRRIAICPSFASKYFLSDCAPRVRRGRAEARTTAGDRGDVLPARQRGSADDRPFAAGARTPSRTSSFGISEVAFAECSAACAFCVG